MATEPPATSKVTSPRGEEFDVVGRAGPVKLRRAPRVRVEAGGQLLVVKHRGIFACSDSNGDIDPRGPTGEGVYADDTRFLSELKLRIGGAAPVLLSHSADLAFLAYVDATNRDLQEGRNVVIPQLTLHVSRVRLVADRLFERIDIHNDGTEDIETIVEVTLAADFAHIFEIRGVRRRMSRGQALAPKPVPEGVRFGYVGQDELFRETFVQFHPEPRELLVEAERAAARWEIGLRPATATSIELEIEPSTGGRRRGRGGFAAAERRVRDDAEQWRRSCSGIESDNELFNRFIAASIRDVHALMTSLDGGSIVAAGIPWYVAPFGRDSLLTGYEMLMLNPAPPRETLLLLARHQAEEDDPARDAEPGKILHEIRFGELARAGLIPHTPYYGTVDATPLFLMLAAAYYRWTADLDTLATLRPALDRALRWIAEHGDSDGDGFVEYHRRSDAGLVNQGWKDSDNAVVHADGSLAEGPIALVEVQGYVYLAKQRIAEVYDALGDGDRAAELRREADRLRRAFNDAFWMADEGTFALALDGRKRQVRSVTSNPGHCLYCDIVDKEKGEALAERLMAPDMFSGWGIRTLSVESPAYNPMSYHNGSVWPHDNAIIAAGLKRYGHKEATEKITTALFEVAFQSRETRLPELYCGFRRHPNAPVVAYPVACSPQAWAAAAPFMLLQSILGVSPRAPDGVLTVNQPSLPSWLNRIDLKGLQVGASKLNLTFTRSGDITAFSLSGRDGDVRVMMQE